MPSVPSPAHAALAPSRNPRLAMAAGVLAALLAGELLLRPVGGPRVYPSVSIAQDSGSLRALERREYAEGIAVSHFSIGGERALEAPAPAGGPALVLLGDSHVEALEVGDGDVMGTELQRLLPQVAIHEYGRSSAGVPHYVLVAPEVLARFSPRWVVVTLVDNDFQDDLFTAPEARMVPGDGGWQVTGKDAWLQVPPEAGTLKRRVADELAARSALFYRLATRGMAATRAWRTPAPAATGVPLPALDERASLALEALARAYGGALRILFIADLGEELGSPTPAEQAVLRHCARLMLKCSSTRTAMDALRRDSLLISRGFPNTIPGVGHLNAVGHRAVARTIAADLVP